MEDFYRNWLRRFRRQTQQVTQRGGEDSEHEETSDSHSEEDEPQVHSLNDPSEIVYENDSLKLVVEKRVFRRQKVFRLQDHLFTFRIVQKKDHEDLPILSDLFDFLHAALVHILESIKSFYNPTDRNIAYMTLHQDPMVNGLNTGSHVPTKLFLFKLTIFQGFRAFIT